eukprot:907-Heterococcus_DN1.PRE.1
MQPTHFEHAPINVHCTGKTLVAAELMKKQIIAIPDKPALFFVPTRQLVVQQACALRHDMNMRVAEFKGGSATPVGFQ